VNILQRIRNILFLLLFSVSFSTLYGQDIHFSQFFNCPLSLNPALTGNFNGDWRVIGNYRDQWRSLNFPYRTLSATYDRQVYIGKHHLSAGFYILNDNSGNIALRTNKIYASGAYYRTFNNHQVNVGLQIGYVLNRIDNSGATLPEQYNPITGRFDLQNSLVADKANYLDVNLGFTWTKKIRIFEPQVGIAFYHLNKPNYSFIDGVNNLPIRSSFHASLKTKLSPVLFVKPAAMLYTMNGSNDFMFGSEVGINILGNRYNIREVTAGCYVRNLVIENVDAMVFMIGAQYSNLSIQLSYDINVSSLNQYTNNRGGLELSVIFKSISTIIKSFTIPCERI
jgi:type IX secretion system PorP/SprF family membrane protein